MFKVGDKVEVINGGSYKMTKTGSYGTITNLDTTIAIVDFCYIVDPKPDSTETTFGISIKHLGLVADVGDYTAYSAFIVFERDPIHFNEGLNKYLKEGYQISNKPYKAPQNGFSVLLEKPPSI